MFSTGPIWLQTGTSGPLRVRRSNIKVTGGRSYTWRPDEGIILNPSDSRFSSYSHFFIFLGIVMRSLDFNLVETFQCCFVQDVLYMRERGSHYKVTSRSSHILSSQ